MAVGLMLSAPLYSPIMLCYNPQTEFIRRLERPGWWVCLPGKWPHLVPGIR